MSRLSFGDGGRARRSIAARWRGRAALACLLTRFRRSRRDAHPCRRRALPPAHPTPLPTARKLQQYGDVTAASVALEIAAVWSALIHLGLAAFGTFVLRRLRTAFAIGGLLGTTAVVSQQDLLLCVGFYKYQHGDHVLNIVFADLAFGLAMVLAFFSLMLGHFRKHVIVR